MAAVDDTPITDEELQLAIIELHENAAADPLVARLRPSYQAADAAGRGQLWLWEFGRRFAEGAQQAGHDPIETAGRLHLIVTAIARPEMGLDGQV